jgi:hypothetical protein|tara:strand:+ start:224 stop:877 length:654 start_codon:yes stop_codon:yes gene_type:complete
LSSSALETTSYSDDYTIDDLESVDLNTATTKGLALSQIRFIKTKVLDANEALGVAGNATYAAARSLVEIKKDVKNKNWKALTDSGVLRMSGRSARDLASAYETWLSSTDIPQDVLSQMSVRTLAKIGNAPANQRTKAVNMLKDGRILSEGDLNKMLRKNTPKKSMDDLLKDAELVASKKTDSEKAQGFTALIMENIKLKKQVADLKEELSKAKALAR